MGISLLSPTAMQRLGKSWNATLLLLAVSMAVFGAYATVQFIDESAKHRSRFIRGIISLGSAISFGLGCVWSLHFLAMAAVQLPLDIHIQYDPILTTLSSMACIVLGFASFGLLDAAGVSVSNLNNQDRWRYPPLRGALGLVVAAVMKTPSKARLLASSLLMGTGVVLLHYVGIAAMRLPPHVHMVIETWSVVWSIFVALVVSLVGLWIVYNVPTTGMRLIASFVIAGAVTAMHMTSFLGVNFLMDSEVYAARLASPPPFNESPELKLALLTGIISSTLRFLLVALLHMFGNLERMYLRWHVGTLYERLSQQDVESQVVGSSLPSLPRMDATSGALISAVASTASSAGASGESSGDDSGSARQHRRSSRPLMAGTMKRIVEGSLGSRSVTPTDSKFSSLPGHLNAPQLVKVAPSQSAGSLRGSVASLEEACLVASAPSLPVTRWLSQPGAHASAAQQTRRSPRIKRSVARPRNSEPSSSKTSSLNISASSGSSSL
eukprot:c11796_g1_i1.p1 GENE.c11796_g1_i1~~c11796_g1_i1.p1  ORF type:complete len:495 (+),score=63.34 c11796_g1_i1:1-1485(+)